VFDIGGSPTSSNREYWVSLIVAVTLRSCCWLVSGFLFFIFFYVNYVDKMLYICAICTPRSLQ
jgi:hypothetical protein